MYVSPDEVAPDEVAPVVLNIFCQIAVLHFYRVSIVAFMLVLEMFLNWFQNIFLLFYLLQIDKIYFVILNMETVIFIHTSKCFISEVQLEHLTWVMIPKGDMNNCFVKIIAGRSHFKT